MLNQKNRRTSLRLDMEKELISVTWIGPDERQYVRDVMCMNVSQGGIQINIDHGIIPKTLVEVRFKSEKSQNKKYLATVLRSVQQEHGWYDISLQFNK